MSFERNDHRRRWKIAAALAVAAVGGCTVTGTEPVCCIDNYPETHALLYGTIRLASGAPAPDALVRAGDVMGARTDAAGKYRLPTTVHGISARTWPLDVKVFRLDTQGRAADSVSVSAQVPFFDAQPPRDSVQVDVIVPWSQ